MKGDLVEVVIDYRSGVQRCDRELDLRYQPRDHGRRGRPGPARIATARPLRSYRFPLLRPLPTAERSPRLSPGSPFSFDRRSSIFLRPLSCFCFATRTPYLRRSELSTLGSCTPPPELGKCRSPQAMSGGHRLRWAGPRSRRIRSRLSAPMCGGRWSSVIPQP